jgi:hypothetical protein
MLHGRFLLRCRTALLWSLYLCKLAGLAGVVETMLPASPRWLLREPVNTIAFGSDGQSFVTAGQTPDLLEPRFRGPVQIREVATGQIKASYFADAHEVASFGLVPTNLDALLLGVLPEPNRAWELHLLNLAHLTARQVDFKCQPGNRLQVTLPTSSSRAMIRQFVQQGAMIADSELALVDLEKGTLLHRWRQGGDWTEPTLHDTVFFTAHGHGGKWSALLVDLEDRKISETESNLDEIRLSADKHVAVTIKKLPPSRQRVKLWDLRAGVILSELVLPEGGFGFSSDARWAFLARAGRQPSGALEFWNLIEKRKVGETPMNIHEDWFDVIDVDRRPLLVVSSAAAAELTARDGDTFDLLWKHEVPRPGIRGAFFKHFLVHELKQRKVLVALDKDVEVFDLLTGEVLRRVPLIEDRYFDGMFGHGAERGGPFTLIAEFRPRDLGMPGWHAWLEESLFPDRRRSVSLAAAIDLEAGRVLFSHRHHVEDPFQRFWLSKDGKNAILSRSDGPDATLLECWDVPARKPWLYIVGLPVLLGLCGVGARKAWRRWRGRVIAPNQAAPNFG